MASSISQSAEKPRGEVQLSERAEQVASQFAMNAVSPFVLATALRVIEFFAVLFIGLAAYFL